MHEMIAIDAGPGFYAFRGRIDGRIVCAATPRVEYDASSRRVARALIRRQGGDCAACLGCVIGRHGDQDQS